MRIKPFAHDGAEEVFIQGTLRRNVMNLTSEEAVDVPASVLDPFVRRAGADLEGNVVGDLVNNQLSASFTAVP
jgi:hypothetical protein